MESTCWILLKSWRKEYFLSKFHDRLFYLVAVPVVQCLCRRCYFYHPHCFYFCFFSARLFSGWYFELLTEHTAFLLFFSTPLFLLQMFLCSNDNSFYDGAFVYAAIFFSVFFYLKSTKCRTFTLSLLLQVIFIILERFGNHKKMKN